MQPPPGVRAPRHHGEAVVDRPRHGGGDQLARDSLTAQGIGNLGMQEEQPVAVYLVGELTHGAVILEHEALLWTVVADSHGEAGPFGDRPRTAPFRNTDTGP